MNSLEFVVVMKDGMKYACLYSQYNDFIELPPPYHPDDIADVKVGRTLAQEAKDIIAEPDFVICPYRQSLESGGRKRRMLSRNQ